MFWTQFLWKNSMTWGVSPSSTKKPCRWSKVSLDVMLPRFSRTSRAQWCPKPRSSIETTWHHEKLRVRLEDYPSYLKRTPTDPWNIPQTTQLPVYEHFGVPWVCSRDLLDFFLVVSEWLNNHGHPKSLRMGLWDPFQTGRFMAYKWGEKPRPYEGTSKWWKKNPWRRPQFLGGKGGIEGGGTLKFPWSWKPSKNYDFHHVKKVGHWSWSQWQVHLYDITRRSQELTVL